MKKPAFRLIACLVCVLFAGCQGTSEESDAAADSAAADTAADVAMQAPNERTATQPAQASSNSSQADGWLASPEDVDTRLVAVYADAKLKADAGEADGFVKLAYTSQQIATMMLQNGKEEEAYDFILQAGRALRAGIDLEAASLPGPEIMLDLFYGEASVLSARGDVPAAIEAMQRAVEQGMTLDHLETLERNPQWANARQADGYAELESGWYQAAADRQLADAADLFPISLAAPDVFGNERTLADLAGKVAIVDVWGTWCGPCRMEIPSFVRLQDSLGEQGFQILGLNYEQSDDAAANLELVQKSISELGINYPCILIDQKFLEQIPNMRGFPTTLFLDKQGRVRHVATGVHSYNYLQSVVKTLMQESAS